MPTPYHKTLQHCQLMLPTSLASGRMSWVDSATTESFATEHHVYKTNWYPCKGEELNCSKNLVRPKFQRAI